MTTNHNGHATGTPKAGGSMDPAVRTRETLVAAAQFFRQVDERTARAAGLTAVEARTLRAVDLVGLTRGITQVGWVTGVQQPAATASVRRLEERGFVRRTARSGEARGAHAALTLTRKGRAKLDMLQALEAQAFGTVLRALGTQAERKTLVDLLELVVAGKLGAVERALVSAIDA